MTGSHLPEEADNEDPPMIYTRSSRIHTRRALIHLSFELCSFEFRIGQAIGLNKKMMGPIIRLVCLEIN